MQIKWVCNERVMECRGLMHPLRDFSRPVHDRSITEGSQACSSSAHPGLLLLCRFSPTLHPEGEEV